MVTGLNIKENNLNKLTIMLYLNYINNSNKNNNNITGLAGIHHYVLINSSQKNLMIL